MRADVEAWVRQARADLRAGGSVSRSAVHCHGRYWLQQACEKGLKAMGLLLWDEKNNPVAATRAFKANFSGNHSPLKKLDAHLARGGVDPSLTAFQRQLRTELNAIDPKKVLDRVDGTTPSQNPADPSYRYPFQDGLLLRAPMDWKAKDWTGYQGHKRSVVVAITRLLERVEDLARRQGGAP